MSILREFTFTQNKLQWFIVIKCISSGILPAVWRTRVAHKYVDCVDRSDT